MCSGTPQSCKRIKRCRGTCALRTSPGGLLPAELPGGILIGTAEKQLPTVKFQLGTAFHGVKGNHPPFGVHPDAKDRSGLGKIPCHVRSSPRATASLGLFNGHTAGVVAAAGDGIRSDDLVLTVVQGEMKFMGAFLGRQALGRASSSAREI